MVHQIIFSIALITNQIYFTVSKSQLITILKLHINELIQSDPNLHKISKKKFIRDCQWEIIDLPQEILSVKEISLQSQINKQLVKEIMNKKIIFTV